MNPPSFARACVALLMLALVLRAAPAWGQSPAEIYEQQVRLGDQTRLAGDYPTALGHYRAALEAAQEKGEWLFVPVVGRAQPAWIERRHVRPLEEE